jgi:hypothetical protein
MEMIRRSIIIATTMLFVLFIATAAMAADPFAGTWKLNVGKSSKTNNPSQSEIFSAEVIENGYRVVRDVVSADGKKEHTEQIITFDGKEFPAPILPGATQTCARMNAYAYVCTVKSDGNERGKIFSLTSSDGISGTLIFTGKNAQGKDFVATFVYDKQ